MPDHPFMREALDYDPETGKRRWLLRPLHHFKSEHAQAAWNAKLAGKSTGEALGSHGHQSICLQGRHWLASRIIWKWMTGLDPVNEIDHINHDPTDNRWCNLREATSSQQKQNRRIQTNNHSGFRGIYKKRNKWQARIKVGDKVHCLGCYATPEEAHAAYVKASDELHGEFGCAG
jgi:hypothetical protein